MEAGSAAVPSAMHRRRQKVNKQLKCQHTNVSEALAALPFAFQQNRASPAAKFGQQSHFPISSAGRSSISSSEEALYRNFATSAAADTTISIHEDMYNSE